MDAQMLKTPSPDGVINFTASGPTSSGQIMTVPDGRAGVRLGLGPLGAGDEIAVAVKGQARIDSVNSGTEFEAGDDVAWDNDEGEAVAGDAAAADVYLGKAVADSGDDGAPVVVDLNAAESPDVGSE